MTKILRVYSELTIDIKQKNTTNGWNELTRSKPLNIMDAGFAALYKGHFGNFPSVAYVPLTETGKMLVICPSSWQQIIQPLVDWKIRKGIEVEVVDVLTAGGTATNIQAFIANKYNNNGIAYVLLVGDAPQLPCLYAQGGPSDPSFGYVLGGDSYAEVMVGRFSAETDQELQTQVDRVLNYEMNPDPMGTWYNQGVVVGSNQGPGDDGEMDWEHAFNMRSDLLAFTYSSVAELYDGTHPGTGDAPGDPTNLDLFNLFQSGIGLMTYTGHGSSTSCSTTGLSNSDVENMTNENKLPFIWSVACVNGQFDMTGGPCFAEKLMREENNGQPTGAIGTFMSSINQSWNPPMDAQDEMVDILVQSYSSNIKYTLGGLSVAGCMHMNDQYGIAGVEMTDTWHLFGDPTLNVRTATPQALTISHAGSMPMGISSLNVNCNFTGALVCLTMNGQILGTGLVAGGSALINFPALSSPDTIFVTVTGFNQIPYLGQVLVVPASGPYVIYQNNTIHDNTGNNDGEIDFSETIDVDFSVQNVGIADAIGVSATLTTTDPYVTITHATSLFGDVLSSSSAFIANAFQFVVANNIPDQHVISFVVSITDGNGNSWFSSFSQVANAPALEGGVLTIDDTQGGDGDGMLEAGESASVIIRCLNNGHSDAPLSAAVISTISSFLNITVPTFNVGLIQKQNFVDATFQVSMLPNVAVGTNYDITLDFNSGAYMANKLYIGSAGIILEDFETGNFNKFNWVMGGNQPWIMSSNAPFDGTFCATNDNIDDSESSDLILNITVMADDSVTFWYRMSSEQDWDYLRYSEDGNELGAWSGITSWIYTGFPITSGSHTLRWSYDKDSDFSSGSDQAWLDNIRLPFGTQVTGVTQITRKNGIAVWPNPTTEYLNVSIKETNEQSISWRLQDLSGREVQSGVQQQNFNSNDVFTINLQGLSSGMYILNLSNASMQKSVKVNVN
ncbi:MAG: T9SS type A sorting domain-containing protein [Bacteroidetes bacterium]|nr:T9SS type A sorting domain-containing protein [Bacteroidota bacterium]